jgi:hypothetical protein
MNDHHIWCNLLRGPVEKCKQCIGLFEMYPQIEGDIDGLELASIHFPNAIPRPNFDL